jgi:hypothetical protein
MNRRGAEDAEGTEGKRIEDTFSIFSLYFSASSAPLRFIPGFSERM